ncbi:hypothetical protein [Acinetobacter pittii]|uniref:hypothetical protein n=1 Tax=Acinetobacter pittii TaxID=48296 RepID=UPI001F224842|nr:hypothetical protein [Acinetobacter pittii]MCE6235585.1 hypothetical protein [Acinetobacter pittii]MCE6689717.1 hypothetical protein [Acinetobacter pittii]MCE6697791.1 hypothetical protein [Acinetobacter pittii]
MMNAYVRPHPDGFKSYLGKNQKTGLYIVRVGWTVYETNGNGSVLYIVKNEDTIPLDVEKFKTDRPKIYAALLSEVQFQRKKQLAIDLQQSYIPSYDRKAYKKRRGFIDS